MTYSIKVRAPLRMECKRRVTDALAVQTDGQPGHRWDRVHVERLLHALIDAQLETPVNDIVVDAYGYVSLAASGAVVQVCANLKVYSAPRQAEDGTVVSLPPELGGHVVLRMCPHVRVLPQP